MLLREIIGRRCLSVKKHKSAVRENEPYGAFFEEKKTIGFKANACQFDLYPLV